MVTVTTLHAENTALYVGMYVVSLLVVLPPKELHWHSDCRPTTGNVPAMKVSASSPVSFEISVYTYVRSYNLPRRMGIIDRLLD